MTQTVLTYKEALSEAGSRYNLNQLIKNGNLHNIARGIYSTAKNPNPFPLAYALYPNAVITMDSALFTYGLTDTPPNEVHLATARDAARICRPGYHQYFVDKPLLNPGAIKDNQGYGTFCIYNRERLLVEVMRRQATLPFDYYTEVIKSYRAISHEIDFQLVEDYMHMFKRHEFMLDILQREVM
jgi:hypothetical protein